MLFFCFRSITPLTFSPTPFHQLTLPDRAVEGYAPKPPSAVDGVTLTHGPYTNTPPLAHSPAWAHYVNNAPFVHVSGKERER